MSISNNYAPDVSIGNGATTIFTGLWSPLNATYMRVYLELISTGAQTLVNQGAGASEYTLSFTSSGYSITMGTAPSALYRLIRAREVALDQTNPYTTAKGFQGLVIENSFDKLTAITQDLSDTVSRSIAFALGSSSTATLPEPEDAKVLGWSGTTLANLTPNTSAYIDPSQFALLAGATFTGAINESHGSDIASASTINLTTATGNLIDVTGTTTITAITLANGAERTVRFTGILTLTHGASLVLPGSANITTAAGDFAVFRGYASGVVRCVVYSKASGAAVTSSASSPITNSVAGSDVSLSNTGLYFDGPSVAQGSAGTWFASGSVTLIDTAGAAKFDVKLWDGTTVIAAGTHSQTAANQTDSVHLSGYLATPAGNLRISARDESSTSGFIQFNGSGLSKDSTITAFRIA